MEKIKLASFDIDVDALIREAQSVKQRIDEIRTEMKEMTKDGKTSSEAFINNAVSLRELNKEYNAQIKVLGEVASANGKVIPLEQELDAIMRRETKTINDLRKQNSDLLKTRNNLNLDNAEHQKLLVQINEQYDRNNQLIKANVSEREQEQMSVGGYTAAIREALNETGLFTGATAQMNQVINISQTIFNTLSVNVVSSAKAMATATTMTGKLSGALRLLRAALISTGIGAFVVALGSLVAYLTTAQEGIDRLNRVLTPLRFAFSGIVNVLADVGEAIVNAFSSPRDLINSFVDAIRPAGDVIAGMFTFDFDRMNRGFTAIGQNVINMAKGAKDFAQALIDGAGEGAELGREYQRLSEQIAREEANIVLYRAEQSRIIKEQNMIAEDITKSSAERERAAQATLDASNNILRAETQLLQLKVAQQAIQRNMSDTLADEVKLNELVAELDDKATQQLELQTTQQNKLNQIRKQATAEQSKAQDEAIKKQNELLDLFVAQQSTRARTMQQDLELEREISERRKEILQAELDAKKISQEKYQAEVIKIENDLLRRQSEIAVENMRREMASVERRVEIEREAERMVTKARFDELVQQEKELSEARAAYEFVRLSEGLITEQEYQDRVTEIRLASERQVQGFMKELKAVENEQRELDLQTQLLAYEAMGASIMEVEALQIEQQRERDLEAARQKYTDEAMLAQAILNIHAEADKAQVELEKQKNVAKWQSNAQLAGALSQLLGEETAAGKAAAIAQATINTYLGATQALASLPPPASFVAMAATIASGIASVAKIMGIGASTPTISASSPNLTATDIATPYLEALPPFATGGIVDRGVPIRRSNGDNVIITAKKGEVILNEKQQRIIGADIFRMARVPGFAGGGMVGASAVQTVVRNQADKALVESIGKAVRQGAESGTAVGSQRGISDLSTERYIQYLSEF